ncbi:predicted protein [Histoplasma capsulatum H143]|uniref:Uncharacterized protein n=1 Tax=Ajellomyces capsulatus (strain H143) TaxID=544712 RepID=C6HC86_AJECH|nr:predicted protein [Histoplasma capsulatum H143]
MGVLRAFFPHVVSREQQGWLGDPFAPGYPFRLLVLRTSPYERGLTFLLSKPEGSRLSSGGFNELRPDFPFPRFLTSYEVLDCMISIIAYGRLLFWPVSEFNCRVELGAWRPGQPRSEWEQYEPPDAGATISTIIEARSRHRIPFATISMSFYASQYQARGIGKVAETTEIKAFEQK